MEGGGGGLFEGGDYLKYFHQRGAIIQGTAIIRGNTLVTRHNKLQTITNLAVIACKLERLTTSCGRKIRDCSQSNFTCKWYCHEVCLLEAF